MEPQASAATIIQFKNSRMSIAAGVALVALDIWAVGMLLLHAQITKVVVLFLVLSCVGIPMIVVTIIGVSDVVMDETGMRRRLLGRNVAGISWTQVVGVRVYSRWNPARRRRGRVICFDRVRKQPNEWHLRRGGLALFDNDIRNSEEVMPVLNKHIAAHNIGIEDLSKGVPVPLKRL